MSRRHIIIVYCALLVGLLSITAFVFVRKSRTNEEPLPRGFSREYSFSEVQANNTVSSCWISFGAQVFDITRLFSTIEPSQASELQSVCGTNLDTLPASIKTREKLSQYQIGILTP